MYNDLDLTSQKFTFVNLEVIWTNLNLHDVRKLSCKYDIFWLSGSQGENFLNTLLNFCIFVIISPLKRHWPFNCTYLNFLYPRMICTKFDWNWPAGSGGFFFNIINTCKYGFPYCGPSRPPGTMLLRNLNLHMTSSSVVHEKIFIWLHAIFVIISPLKRNWHFIWTIQNSIYPRMICTTFDWNWPSGSGEFFFLQYKHKLIWFPLL
jgi:hypothetical protein